MASSSSSHKDYDVFISFRGSDIRHGFLSHLKKTLQEEIDVYVDERVERGDEISSALLQAIEASEISLIIFSEDYATSKWCLEELVKIMECKELNKQTVIPVFYNIDPSDVRHQKGTYEDAFVQHEQKLKDNTEKVQNWRSALNKAANLSGYHYSSNFENESELIDEIMKDVLKKLSFVSTVETKPLLGIDSSISYIKSLLGKKPKGVQVIGIWGMGGIGKTTLAQAVFNKFSSQYQSCCFLENVRQETEKNGLSHLLNKLLSELLDEENSNKHFTAKAKSSLIKRKLRRKRVLIVLDDMNTREQFEFLAKELNCLGPSSGVIITSRDKHVLHDNRVDAIHEVKELNFQESLKLFSLNAFNQSHPKMEYEELSEKAVVYTKGIPLALKVLGSYFHSRNIETWKSALQKLHKYPNGQIQNVLKVSYDGLDYVEKDIFLDIAFFFKRERRDDVTRILDACGFYGASGIDSLLHKALVTISNNNTIEMHDLIQEMGEQVVREECIKHPGRRSRLNDTEEIYDVLKNNKGSEAVEGIVLDLSQIRNVKLSADALKNMTSLRILKLYSYLRNRSCSVRLPHGLESFSDKLSYFRWDAYPLESLPVTFHAEKLVELHLEGSKVIKLWEGLQDLVNLRRINLRRSSHLLELPDFSRAQKLEKVNLSFCSSLCNVHPSILSLHSLVTLDVRECNRLKSLQSVIHLKSLVDLDVHGCYGLQIFSLSSEKITELDLISTGIKTLHSTIGHNRNLSKLYLNGSTLSTLSIKALSCLKSLVQFSLYKCELLLDKAKLHILLDGLRSLKYLHLVECGNLSELSENISGLSSLKVLCLVGSSIESLPASIKHLSYLEKIDLTDCEKLRFVPELPSCLTHLYADNCSSLETVAFRLRHRKHMPCFFSFKNCLNLDELSLYLLTVEFALFSVFQAVSNDNRQGVELLYPGNRVPKWFGHEQTTEASITIKFAPSFDHGLKGFILCFVLSPHFLKGGYWVFLRYRYYFGDGEKVAERMRRYHSIMYPIINSDHVFLWYCPLDSKVATNDSKVSFDFWIDCYRVSEIFTHIDLHHLIKACGVYPIYASQVINFVHQRELEMKTKRFRDIDEDQLLPPTKKRN